MKMIKTMITVAALTVSVTSMAGAVDDFLAKLMDPVAYCKDEVKAYNNANKKISFYNPDWEAYRTAGIFHGSNVGSLESFYKGCIQIRTESINESSADANFLRSL